MPPKVAAFMAASAPPTCDVWPQNWPSLVLFLAMDTQWRVGPRGQVIGLDYAALSVVRDGLAIAPADWPPLFADLQLMEDAVLEEFAAKG